MKILLINKFHYLKGGSERYVFLLQKLLEEHGHEVIFFSMNDLKNSPSRWSKYFINYVDMEKFSFKNIFKIFYNYDASKKLKKIIKEQKPDIAHLHNIAHQIGPMLINILKKNNIPAIQTLHDLKLVCPAYRAERNGELCLACRGGAYYNCARFQCLKKSYAKSFLAMLEAYYERIFLRAYDKVDCFISPTKFMKDICVRFGVSENKIKVIPHFIATEEILKEPRREYLLYVGRLSTEKGVNVLLSALKKCPAEKLKIAGAGPESDNLQRAVVGSNLQDRVEFLGQQNQNDLKNLIKNAKAIIAPSLALENMPYVIMEAIASGKIVIASGVGGIPEIIKDGENGFLFKSGDPDDLSAKILALKNCDFLKVEQKAYEQAIGLNPEKHYQELYDIYLKLANK